MRLSYSTIELFLGCKRQFYLSKIKQLPIEQDMSYADRGTLVHQLLESFMRRGLSTITDYNTIVSEFNIEWDKYDFDNNPKMKYDKTKTLTMIINGLNLKLPFTDLEYKFRFKTPDYIGYADVLDATNNTVYDWKTSTWRTDVSENQYKHQMKYYAWAYNKEHDIIPTTEVIFLKHNKKVSYSFTIDELNQVETEINYINNYIETHDKEEDYPKCSDNVNACPMFCPYKQICFGEVIKFDLEINGTMVKIKNQIPDLLNQTLYKKFSYQDKNTHWIQKSGSDWDGVHRFYNKLNRSLPIGFMKSLINFLKAFADYNKLPLDFSITDNRQESKNISNVYPAELQGITLREYQVESVDTFLFNKVGCLNLSVGAGKTEIAAEIIRRLSVPTLILTHKKELLEQTKNRIEERLNTQVGVINANNTDVKLITIAMIQTLHSRPQYINQIKNIFDLIIVDECHHTKASTWVKLLKNFPAKYRLGLSGSILDEDENMYIESQLGPVIKTISSEELMTLGYLSLPTVHILHPKPKLCIGEWSDIENEHIINNEERNNMIKNICEKEKGFVVIIVKKIEHGNLLNTIIPNSFFINGQLNNKDRIEIMRKARNNEIKVLIGTVINEGIDLPNIDTIIMASGGKSDIFTIQSAGRVLRLNNNANKKIYDFYDDGKYIRTHSKNRIDVYKQYSKNILME